MKYILRLREEVDRDLTEAAFWYEKQQIGLGHDFLDAVVATFDSIAARPLSNPVIHRKTRRALVSKFPFGVFYHLAGYNIVVVAVMHGSRHPARWQKRETKL